MLKFITNHMSTIAGIAIYPIITMLIYIGFFVGLFLWVMTYKKDTIKTLSALPLDDEEQ